MNYKFHSRAAAAVDAAVAVVTGVAVYVLAGLWMLHTSILRGYPCCHFCNGLLPRHSHVVSFGACEDSKLPFLVSHKALAG